MNIAAKANKVCKIIQKNHEYIIKNKKIKKPMNIPSKTRKNQKTHEHSSNPCQKVLKPMSIASKTLRAKPPAGAEHLSVARPSVDKHSSLTLPHSFASPARLHARHEHETKPKPISRLGVSCVD